MKKDFGHYFKSVSNSQVFKFENILLDTVVIGKLPEDEIIYSIFTNFDYVGYPFAVSLDFPDDDMMVSMFTHFFESHLSFETLSRFRELFQTDYYDYVKFGEYNYKFSCIAKLGEPVMAENEIYVPFIIQEIIILS